MSSQIHIASFVLHARPDATAAIAKQLHAFSEVEIVSVCGGKVVFLIEAAHERRIVEIVDTLRDVPAVLSAAMVEHHADSAEAMLQEVRQ
jgi:periplasmic nitrate reductase NapD